MVCFVICKHRAITIPKFVPLLYPHLTGSATGFLIFTLLRKRLAVRWKSLAFWICFSVGHFAFSFVRRSFGAKIWNKKCERGNKPVEAFFVIEVFTTGQPMPWKACCQPSVYKGLAKNYLAVTVCCIPLRTTLSRILTSCTVLCSGLNLLGPKPGIRIEINEGRSRLKN